MCQIAKKMFSIYSWPNNKSLVGLFQLREPFWLIADNDLCDLSGNKLTLRNNKLSMSIAKKTNALTALIVAKLYFHKFYAINKQELYNELKNNTTFHKI